jgi:hypothetical protein
MRRLSAIKAWKQMERLLDKTGDARFKEQVLRAAIAYRDAECLAVMKETIHRGLPGSRWRRSSSED